MTRHTVLFVTLLALASGTDASPEAREWRFRVFLDDAEIGYHRYALRHNGRARELTSEARFNLRILMFDVYQYEHRAVEDWQGDCLARIESQTNDDGERLSVEGGRAGDGFVVSGDGLRSELPACVMSFAYWNPAMLKQSRLLNSQDGKFLDVAVQPLGTESIMVRGAKVTASRYALVTEKFRIDVWYSADGEWLALESAARGNRKLRYRLQ
ncbi:MAG: DUF6134 family protein [Chromatiales bacterium]